MLDDGILPPPYAIDIAVQVCEALAFAHGKGIVHKDIKPENILVSEYGEPMLADFGISALADVSHTTSSSVALTPIGYVLVGPLSELVGVAGALYLAAAVNVTASLVVLAMPSVRAIRSGPELA